MTSPSHLRNRGYDGEGGRNLCGLERPNTCVKNRKSLYASRHPRFPRMTTQPNRAMGLPSCRSRQGFCSPRSHGSTDERNREVSRPITGYIDNAKWLAGVRDDLDSAAEDWPPDKPKTDMIAGYLDTILTELGHRGRFHDCPECGAHHAAPKARP